MVYLPLVIAIWALAIAPAAQALIGGEADHEGTYAAVVPIRIGHRGLCTATKVGPCHLLTAAHCLVDPHTGRPRIGPDAAGNGALTIAVGDYHRAGGRIPRTIGVAALRFPPEYRAALARFIAYRTDRLAKLQERLAPADLTRAERALRIGHHFSARFPDVAIVQLTEEIGSIPTIELDLDALPTGSQVVLVGFGCRDASAATSTRMPDVPAWGRSRVLGVETHSLYTAGNQKDSTAPSLCPGDSGGPVLRDGRVVGIHSVVHGLHRSHGARSNMAIHLRALSDWLAAEGLTEAQVDCPSPRP